MSVCLASSLRPRYTGCNRVELGQTGSIQDIREGDVVEAAYEPHDGKNIAILIKVTEAEPRRGVGAPQRSAAPSGAPRLGPPQGSEAPVTDGPQAPY